MKTLGTKMTIAVLAIILTLEISLRVCGLGRPVLSQKDAFCAYRFQPNQHHVILGKRIDYNKWSQRSPNFSELPGGRRLFLIGDSVVNGGVATDQSQTIGELIAGALPGVEVMSASAGSWGMCNELGYIREFGTFHSQIGVLEIGTNDLDQPTSTSARVGVSPDLPNREPYSAIGFCFSKYVLPRLGHHGAPEIPVSTANPEAQVSQNIACASSILSSFHANRMRAFVVFVPTSDNRVPPVKQSFLSALKAQAHVIDFQQHARPAYYRDLHHLNPLGDRAFVDVLLEEVRRAQ